MVIIHIEYLYCIWTNKNYEFIFHVKDGMVDNTAIAIGFAFKQYIVSQILRLKEMSWLNIVKIKHNDINENIDESYIQMILSMQIPISYVIPMSINILINY